MPSSLALVLYLSVVVWLFRRDFKERPNVTRALWIPFLWLFIIMSRFFSAWLGMFGIHVGGVSVEEGSPVDALFAASLIIAGLRVLARRGVSLGELMRRNRWLTIFFAYCFLAVIWSDFPFVAFKRWVKILGQPIMVLVLFTEPDFERAIIVLFKRLAYVLVPVSVLFIKYFPEIGRGFSPWTGQGFNCGITLGKNDLGVDCLILGFFFVWYMSRVWRMKRGLQRRNELILCAAFLILIGWLMKQAQSSTSLGACVLAVTMFLFLGLKSVKKDYVGTYVIFAVILCAVGEYFFQISDLAFHALGRDRTMTDRTLVWQQCLSIQINPILGVGFESFWLGERQQIMNLKWAGKWQPNEAHNGYLETYLNLGGMGLFILLCLLVAVFWKARNELIYNYSFGRFRVSFLMAILAYNWTEASFRALHPMYFLFYLIALDYPKNGPEPVVETEIEAIDAEADPAEITDSGEEPNRHPGWLPTR